MLWPEYQRIKNKGTGWDDDDVRFLLEFIEDIQETQLEISEQLKTALDQLDKLHQRVQFYRDIYPIKPVE